MNILKNHRYLIKDIAVSKRGIFVELYPYKIIVIPFSYTKKLQEANIEDLMDYKIIGNGVGVHFEKIDEDLSVDGIVNDFIDEYEDITVSLPVSFIKKLDEYALSKHIDRSELIEEATKIYILEKG